MAHLRWLPIAAMFALTACVAPARIAGRTGPGPAAAAGVTHEEGLFDGEGGIKLFEQSWHPQGPAKAVLIMVHGLKDHSSRYAATAEQLVGHGYAVYAFDLRGHGFSGGPRVYVDSFNDYLSDLDLFVARVQQREPGKPLFLFGHSMGGAIVTLYTITRAPVLKGLVLSGPALKAGSDVSPFLIGVTKGLGGIFPGLPVLDLDDKAFSRDPQAVADMQHDPEVYDHPGPARTAAELLGAIERIQQKMENVAVPLLVMHGTADRLTNPEGSKELQARSDSRDKTLKLFDGLYHDLLHEPEKAEVFSTMVQWMDARAPAP